MTSFIHSHYLIIGSGIAGLTLAIKLAETYPEKTITIVTKDRVEESNTKYAQGGIAVVLDKLSDSFENHIQDTLNAGDGLCNKEVVERVIKEGPKYFQTLLKWGSQFDLNKNGKFNLGKEGGHSHHRVVHHKDMTGFEIERALLNKVHHLKNINILDHHFAIDLVTNNKTCIGLSVLNCKTNNIEYVLAETTSIATGGIGQIYGHTTNPSVATGDGIAMAARAKANISNMEFIQFHPTVLHSNQTTSAFLISEAVRGFGAHLKQKDGKRFMFRFDDRGELASRDIVSKAIDTVLKETRHTCVYLDCTHLDIEDFKTQFPNISQHCLSQGINVSKDWIPVVPAVHYLCGGIEVNEYGQTSIQNLFACGECSNTGLHGANRLASNSLLEALVYAHHIFEYHVSNSTALEHTSKPHIPFCFQHSINNESINTMKTLLQQLMRTHVGIVRHQSELYLALQQLNILQTTVDKLSEKSAPNIKLFELRNMIEVALLIVSQSIERDDNRGGFFKTDIQSGQVS